jgi:hypothetical protein
LSESRLIPDEALLSRCRVETFRGPGPGGQKRNKTSSNVRITHLPSGVAAIAGDSRSQSKNKDIALRRLRLRLAIEQREPFTPPPPAWFRLDVSPKNDTYPAVVGVVLDALAAVDWALAPARESLGVGSSQLIRFLKDDPDIWTAVQQHRAAAGLHPLT